MLLVGLGNLTPYMMSYLKIRVDPNLDPGSAVWISAIALAMQGLSMPLGGAAAPKIGYRAVVIIGSLINSGSVILTYFTIQKGFIYVVITYAVTLGFGFGLSYAIIFSVAASWFPARRALIVGLIVGGFGLGALVFTPIQTMYINPDNVMINNASRLFENDALLDRVPSAFLMLGGSLAALQFIGILLLRQKPETTPKASAQTDDSGTKRELTSLVQSGDATDERQGTGDEKAQTSDKLREARMRLRRKSSLAMAHSNIANLSPIRDMKDVEEPP
ncbi:unnamed protein product [Mesocestoides corti]|uniref:Major facilitator superfamily (MFS) profile domain-containing protein n=2 Tax=Mesocestoides corti TaxID=53468 RepID=A0A0R3UQT5_MESCO|nr:unnamed protein product [Mesocestoides corti]